MPPERLTSPLVVVEAQHGFVGEAGTITTVEPDGTFTIADFVRDAVQPPRQRGRLPEDALGRVAHSVATELGPGMPERVEGAAGANPRRVTVRYGSAASTVILPADAAPEDASAELAGDADAPRGRVLRVWRAVRDAVTPR
jgi:hypothetical protein